MSAIIPAVPRLAVVGRNFVVGVFHGVQEGFEHIPAIPLYNLLVPVPGHPAGSTVSADTLRKLGIATR